jgi:hypothetical protein
MGMSVAFVRKRSVMVATPHGTRAERDGVHVLGFAEDLAEPALELHGEPTMEETLDRVLEYAVKALDCSYAGVVFVQAGKTGAEVETTAATHEVVTLLDKVQQECGEGPDMDVLSDRFSIIVSDTETETRWPTWARRVAECGIRSLLSVRLYTSSNTVGTLNLYDHLPDKFDVDDQAVAHILARHAAVALSSARETEHLWRAIDARKIIGQAQGILMERFDLTADKAFSVLLRHSQDKNIKLRVVAERLIATRKLPHWLGARRRSEAAKMTARPCFAGHLVRPDGQGSGDRGSQLVRGLAQHRPPRHVAKQRSIRDPVVEHLVDDGRRNVQP